MDGKAPRSIVRTVGSSSRAGCQSSLCPSESPPARAQNRQAVLGHHNRPVRATSGLELPSRRQPPDGPSPVRQLQRPLGRAEGVAHVPAGLRRREAPPPEARSAAPPPPPQVERFDPYPVAGIFWVRRSFAGRGASPGGASIRAFWTTSP